MKKDQTSALMTPESRGKRLRFLLYQVLGKSAVELGREYDFLNEITLRGWLGGLHGGLSQKGAQKIITVAQTFGINVALEWLLYGIEPGPTAEDILTVFKHKSAQESKSELGAESIPTQSKDDQAMIKELALFAQTYPRHLSFKINDDGMLHYNVGDLIAGVAYRKDLQNYVGEDCIIQTRDKRVFFRRLQRKNADATFNLSCTNPDATVKDFAINNIEIAKIAPVIWQRRSLK